jgi:hypothetical protein
VFTVTKVEENKTSPASKEASILASGNLTRQERTDIKVK